MARLYILGHRCNLLLVLKLIHVVKCEVCAVILIRELLTLLPDILIATFGPYTRLIVALCSVLRPVTRIFACIQFLLNWGLLAALEFRSLIQKISANIA